MPERTVFFSVTTPDGVKLRCAHRHPPASTHPRVQGLALLLHGRSEYIEKYRETMAALADRGWVVLTFDWRGQGLSGGRDDENPQRHHVADFAALADDIDVVLQSAPAQALSADVPGRRIVLAHSMGGLLATFHLLRHPDTYHAAVLCSPMYGLITKPWPHWAARGAAWLASRLGHGRHYAFGQHDFDPLEAVFTPDNPLTGDPDRYAIMPNDWAVRTELRLGGVTFGWLDAAFRAQRLLAGTAALSTVLTRVLILSAPDDGLVDARTHRRIAGRFAHASVSTFAGGKHELLNEGDAIRHGVWQEIDDFLGRLSG